MRCRRVIVTAAAALLAGCISSGLPRPVLRYDEKDRLVERKQYDRSGRLLSETEYVYPDPSICVERSTDYLDGGGRTESEIYHVWDTPISYKSVRTYDAEGALLTEQSHLLPAQRGAVGVMEGWSPDAEPSRN